MSTTELIDMSTTKRVDRYVNDKELIDMSTTKS